MKVNNKQAVREVAWKMYKAETKRNLLSVFAICMASFLIAVMSATGSSYWNTLTQRQLRMQGIDYDLELSEPRKDQVEIVRAMDEVKYAGLSVACAIIEQYQDQAIDQAKLYWADDICWDKQIVPALETYKGHYPVKENEVMLSEALLKAMHLEHWEPGMKLSFTYTIMVSGGMDRAVCQEFVLSGWYRDYSGIEKGYVSKAFYDAAGVQQTDLGLGALKISLVNPLYFAKDISRMNEAVGITGRQRIQADDYAIPHFCQVMLALAGLFLMVLASAYLFVFNTMYISITKNIRCYGQLKTIGMTSIQLKGVVYRQALFNAAPGILAGLTGAVLVSKTAVPKLLLMVNGAYEESMIVPISPWAFLAAGLFVLFVNFASCRKPAKIAGDCSSVEALRYTAGSVAANRAYDTPGAGARSIQADSKAREKKSRRREHAFLPHMAWQNIFRDRKQAAVIFLSSAVALSVFFTVNVAMLGNDAKHILNEKSVYDMRFVNQTMLKKKKQVFTKEKMEQLQSIDGVKEIRKVTSAFASIPFQEEVFGTFYRALYASRYSPGNYKEDMEKYKNDTDHSWSDSFFGTRLAGIDEKGFAVLNESLGNTLDKQEFENGTVAVALESAFLPGDFGIPGKTVHFYVPESLEPDREYRVKIAAVSGRIVNYFGAGCTPFLVVSEKFMKKILGETYTELIEIDYEKPYSRKTETAVKALFANEKQVTSASKLEQYKSMQESETKMKVLGYSIGFITAALALLNYINMMAAAVQNRRKEFATLESIGMTGKQICSMLCIEGAGYGAVSVIASFVMGTACSYVIFDGLTSYQVSYAVPWGNTILLYAAASCMCIVSPPVLFRLTQKGNVIERMQKGDEL